MGASGTEDVLPTAGMLRAQHRESGTSVGSLYFLQGRLGAGDITPAALGRRIGGLVWRGSEWEGALAAAGRQGLWVPWGPCRAA